MQMEFLDPTNLLHFGTSELVALNEALLRIPIFQQKSSRGGILPFCVNVYMFVCVCLGVGVFTCLCVCA